MPTANEPPARPTRPACHGHRIQTLTGSVTSQRNEGRFDGPVTRERMTCGHVWRLAANGEPPRSGSPP